MKLFFVLVLACSAAVSVRARSAISAVRTNNGRTLAIDVIDSPSEPPFTAGEIWTGMATPGMNRSAKSANFSINCSAANTPPDSSIFGSCSLEVALSLCREDPTNLHCGAFGPEAEELLKAFKVESGDFLVRAPENAFIFQASLVPSFVGFTLSKKLLHRLD